MEVIVIIINTNGSKVGVLFKAKLMLAEKAHCDVGVAEAALEGKQEIAEFIKNEIGQKEKVADEDAARVEEVKKIEEEVKGINEKSNENIEMLQKAINVMSGITEPSHERESLFNLRKRDTHKKLRRRHYNRKHKPGRFAKNSWRRVKRCYHKKKRYELDTPIETDQNMDD